MGGELASAEVVEDKQVGGEPTSELVLQGVIGLGLMQGLQELRDGDEADAVAGPVPHLFGASIDGASHWGFASPVGQMFPGVT